MAYKYKSYYGHLNIITYIVDSRWYSYASMVITLRGLRGLSKWVIELIRVISVLIEVITQHKNMYSHQQPPRPP